MRIDVERIGDVLVIEVPSGNLDAANSMEFREAVESLIERGTRLLIDMENVTFVDSSGLGSILSLKRDLGERRGELKICGMLDSVASMFSLVRMDRVFDIHRTRDEAVEAF